MEREAFGEFESAPNAVERSGYVVVLDVSAYYVYVDHDLLMQELIAQTGDGPAIDTLAEFLMNVMGRRVGLPQVSPVSDILGDTHLDVVRRKLVRRGYQVTRYADDFRIVTSTLGDARAALEECAAELYTLGLVLNEGKTRILTSDNYQRWATRFRDAERQMFREGESVTAEDGDAIAQFFSTTSRYGRDDTPVPDATSDTDEVDSVLDAAESPLLQTPDKRSDDETLEHPTVGAGNKLSEGVTRAARRAWGLWISGEADTRYDAATKRKLASRALRVLGHADDDSPLTSLDRLLSQEPGLTPDLVAYLTSIPIGDTRVQARSALNDLLENKHLLSTWQKVWIADAAGKLGPMTLGRDSPPAEVPYLRWLHECLNADNDALAATAAHSLGRLRAGSAAELAAIVEKVADQWKPLALLGLARVDEKKALDCAGGALDRLMLGHP